MGSLVINTEFERGQIVYLKTDPEQLERIVYAYYIDNNDETKYELRVGMDWSIHVGFEISLEPSYAEEED